MSGAVDIIVPIFNAIADVGRLLVSLKRHAPSYARLWLVNDASTDANILPMLQQFQADVPIKTEVLTNTCNLGFVGTVNRALALAKNDVLLLNSDTIVSAAFLDHMRAMAEREGRVGSITPWSNNAEICSFPNFCQVNAAPGDLTKIASAVRKLPAEAVELPTGVGFCMWMSAAALRAVGDFDGALFGRGYGEENDWCRRAAGHGYRNLFCPQSYVAHVGGSSFSATGEKPGGENLKRLLARYPNYNAIIGDFIKRDPLQGLRAKLSELLQAGDL
jgi:GT2 family glycosyltransferase